MGTAMDSHIGDWQMSEKIEPPKMPQRLEAAGIYLPPMGFGAFKIGRNTSIKYAEGYDLPTASESTAMLNDIVDMGLCFIDAAPAYGIAEERIGEALGERRGDFILSTKVGEIFDGTSSTYDFSVDGIYRSVESSLKKLRTDHLDILLIHSSRDDMKVLMETDAEKVLTSLKEKGIARAIGFSGYTHAAFVKSFGWADAIMLEYHPEDQQHEATIRLAADQGIACLIKKPLGQGKIAPQDALPFSLNNSGVTSVVIGGLNMRHLRENWSIARDVRPGQAEEARTFLN